MTNPPTSEKSSTPPTPQAGEPSEAELWTGGPSQAIAWDWYAFCILILIAALGLTFYLWSLWPLLGAIVAAAMAVWKYMRISSLQYTLTTERLLTTTGVMTRRTEHIELYRIKDSSLIEPFWYRQMGVGNIVLITSDASTPRLELRAIAHSREAWDLIRKQVEIVRTKKGVREVDVE